MRDFESLIRQAVQQAVKNVYDLDAAAGMLVVETPRDPKMGDYATSIAMRLAKTLHQAPIAIAQALTPEIKKLLPEASSIEEASGSSFLISGVRACAIAIGA